MKISAILFFKDANPKEVLRVIESCHIQSHQDWELIIQQHANGSDTQYWPDSRVKWYREADKGTDDAMLKGWHKVTGDLVTWMGVDDWFEFGAFEEASDHMEADAYHWPAAFCGQLNLWQDGKNIGQNQVYELPFHSYLNDFAHPGTTSTFFRRSSFKNPYPTNVEFSMWMQAYQTSRILWTNRVLANYTIKPGQMSEKTAIERLQTRIPIMKENDVDETYIKNIEEKIKYLEKIKC